MNFVLPRIFPSLGHCLFSWPFGVFDFLPSESFKLRCVKRFISRCLMQTVLLGMQLQATLKKKLSRCYKLYERWHYTPVSRHQLLVKFLNVGQVKLPYMIRAFGLEYFFFPWCFDSSHYGHLTAYLGNLLTHLVRKLFTK